MLDNAGLRGAAEVASRNTASVASVKIADGAGRFYPFKENTDAEYWKERALEAESQVHFNGLTPAETERLDMLVEELSEVIMIAQKIKRHGYESYHPDDPRQTTNRRLLEIELGDVLGILNKMYFEYDLDENYILSQAYTKWDRSFKYTHHQTNET